VNQVFSSVPKKSKVLDAACGAGNTAWPAGEWIGRSFQPLVHPDDLSYVMQRFGQVMHGSLPSVFEARIRSLHGQYVEFEISAKPLIESGIVQGAVGIARDITERKNAERALVESKAAFEAFFNDDLTADYVVTPEGKILECNPAFVRLFKFESREKTDINKLDARLWSKVVYDMIDVFSKTEDNASIVESLKSLYFGRVVSFMNQTWEMSSEEAEEFIIDQGQVFFDNRKYLLDKIL